MINMNNPQNILELKKKINFGLKFWLKFEDNSILGKGWANLLEAIDKDEINLDILDRILETAMFLSLSFVKLFDNVSKYKLDNGITLWHSMSICIRNIQTT